MYSHMERALSCAIYARVSTEDQTCALQLDECRSYAERRGWALFAEYVDTGWSGAKQHRPQLDKLMNDAKKHRFDVVICWKVDRFGRSVAHFVQNLQSLDSWGVRFLVTTQSIDTDSNNPSSRLLMCILAAVAEFERSMICERVKAGVKAARKRGVQWGRRPIILDKMKVREMHLRGKSVRQIAADLKVSKTKIQNIVKAAAA